MNYPDAKEAAQIVLSDKELHELVLRDIDFVKGWIEKGSDKVIPMLNVYYRTNFDAPIQQVPMILADLDDNRHELMRVVGAKFFLDNNEMTKSPKDSIYFPLAITFMSEAWTRKFSPEQPMPEGMKVSDYDDKQEHVVVVGMSVDKRSVMSFIEVSRDDKGQITLGEVVVQQSKDTVNNKIYILEAFYEGFMKALYNSDYLSKSLKRQAEHKES